MLASISVAIRYVKASIDSSVSRASSTNARYRVCMPNIRWVPSLTHSIRHDEGLPLREEKGVASTLIGKGVSSNVPMKERFDGEQDEAKMTICRLSDHI